MSNSQPETKKKEAWTKGNEGRMRVLQHGTPPAITKHDEEEEDWEKI